MSRIVLGVVSCICLNQVLLVFHYKVSHQVLKFERTDAFGEVRVSVWNQDEHSTPTWAAYDGPGATNGVLTFSTVVAPFQNSRSNYLAKSILQHIFRTRPVFATQDLTQLLELFYGTQ